jgi:hypothetical protein
MRSKRETGVWVKALARHACGGSDATPALTGDYGEGKRAACAPRSEVERAALPPGGGTQR